VSTHRVKPKGMLFRIIALNGLHKFAFMQAERAAELPDVL
jgi:hypothetical protein